MDRYKATSAFPRDEVYGLAVPMPRGLIAMPGNIAQGQAQYFPASFAIPWAAPVELAEVETQIVIAQNPECRSSERGQFLLVNSSKLSKIISGLASAIRPAD